MRKEENINGQIVHWGALILFPLVFAAVIWFDWRLFYSFSFQTSLLGWLYLLTGNIIFGHFSTRYLSFVVLIWAVFPKHFENNEAEYIINHFARILFLICSIYYFLRTPAYFRGVRYQLLGLLYPLGYYFFILLVNPCNIYELYPMLDIHPALVVSLFATTEAINWIINFIVNRP